MNHSLLRVPGSAPTVWDTDMVARIRKRVDAAGLGEKQSCGLLVLLIQSKLDGTSAKLALLAGVSTSKWKPALAAALELLVKEPSFNRHFHLIRSAL